jgi:hypothetical protein
MMIYTCAAVLEHGEFPRLQRKIGVTVYGPYDHAGMGQVVEVEYQRLEIDSAGFGKPVPVDDMPGAVRQGLETLVADLDTKIAELQRHRERLATELERLRNT